LYVKRFAKNFPKSSPAGFILFSSRNRASNTKPRPQKLAIMRTLF